MANANKNKAAKSMAAKTQQKNETVKKGVTYTFAGEYYCRDDRGLLAKVYELAVTFPELLANPLSAFKKGVNETGNPIRNLMVKKYPDYTSVRTYSVIKCENNTGAKPKKANDIEIMNVEQLQQFIDENDLGINTEIYNNDVVKIREMITLAQDDPEKFETVYAEQVKEYEYNKELEALNDENVTGETTDEATTDSTNDEDVDDLLDDLDGDENGTNE